MRDILIKHKDKSELRLAIEKPVNGYSKVDASYTGNDGYYKAGLSWSKELPISDIEKQLESVNYKEF